MFRRSKKLPPETIPDKDEDDVEDDNENVFDDDSVNSTTQRDLPKQDKTKPEKPNKYDKNYKPEKPPKPAKLPKLTKSPKKQQQTSDGAKRKISAPIFEDGTSEMLNPGLEGRPLCRLLKVNEDETRVVEMIRPHTGPLGVFFTKGQEHHDEGKLLVAITVRGISRRPSINMYVYVTI